MGEINQSLGLLWVAVVSLTVFVRVGFSEDYQARVGPRNNLFLQRVKRQSRSARPELKVTDFHVRCSVVSRYAATSVQSSVWNTLPVTKEAAFEVDLPSSAFISNFSITSNGKVYVAQVQERSAAKKIYDAAKKRGKTAGLVATKEREVEKFRVAVSVPSGERLSFSLTYEELLSRRLGRYQLVLGLRPGQPVQNLTLEVSVAERSGISFIRALPLRTNRLLSNTVSGEAEAPPSTQVVQTPRCAQVRYTPSLQQQTSSSPKGLNADFVIEYDVELNDLMGDIQIYDGYFVHYFAPRGLPVVPKDVIFVIDISGSMTGTKIKQTKQAMATILTDLREGDHFNIITFSDKVHTWKKGEAVQATRQNVREAKEFVKKINADGWTNINSALLSAAQLVNSASSRAGAGRSGVRRVPLVIFLTDGEATTGVTAGEAILRNAREALGPAALFGLAFGDDADLPLLRRLALENRGVARTVYEDADAALQLKGFYDEVASPLLSDVQLAYLDDRAFDVTRALFPHYFQGSELVVAGRVKPGVRDLKVSLTASDSTRRLRLENDVAAGGGGGGPEGNGTADWLACPGGADGISSFVRRLWAYFTIKELLQAKLNSTDPPTQRLLGEKATNLSLKYNFVTPVTSLVVVKPDVDEVTPSSTPSPSSTAATTPAPTTHTTTTIAATTGGPTTHTTTTTTSGRTATTAAPTIATTTSGTTATTAAPAHVPPKKSASTSGPRPRKTKQGSGPNTKRPPHAPPSGIHTTGRPLQPPHSGRLSTTPSTGKAAAPLPPKKSTATPPPASVRTTSTPPPSSDKTVPPPPSSAKTTPQTPAALPPIPSSPQPEDGTAPPTDARHAHLTTLVLSGHAPATPLPDADLGTAEVATLISGTFVPMPGVTEPPKPWEAAGPPDYEANYEYDYDISYDTLDSQFRTGSLNVVASSDYEANYEYDYDISYDTLDSQFRTGSLNVVASSDYEANYEYDYDISYATADSQPSRASQKIFASSVDGDPHFVVWIPQLDESLCFTVDGRANDVLRLLEDPEKGIIVDGHLTYAPSKHGFEDQSRTYFDQLTISVPTGGGVVVRVTLDSVVLEGEGRELLPTDRPGSVARQGLRVAVDDHLRCWVELGWGLRFLILFHHYKHPTYLQIAHMGFYVADGRGLSPLTQGLLGQFQHADIEVTNVRSVGSAPPAQDTGGRHLAEGVLWIGGVRGRAHVPVSLQEKHLKDSVHKRHLGTCWVVPKAQVEAILGHSYESYVVDHV
ncbi:inter-alpha-trypsin inhibitor heavy chain H6 [Anguilla anguilla]|uniref:inter-alpha-trypsin inhibitor heavy chain H6 n=1 Tax=Anguilla anguilla TaxID=7936 RepID=UPI0015AC1445|nr:inter-alpha-trypsin inhibitor heavy chain H6 [Anguilla anguilla]